MYPCRSASDWFVDKLVFTLAPREFQREVREHLSLILTHPKDDQVSPLHFYGTALIIAQASLYLGQKIQTAGNLTEAVEAFLSINPAQPTIDKLADLVNRLAALMTPWRVRLIEDAGFEVWTAEKPSQ